MRALIVISLLAGCGEWFSLAYKDGAKIAACAVQDYAFVDQAIHQGQVNTGDQVFEWLGFIASNLECVAPVVEDIYRAAKAPKKTACAGGSGCVAPTARPSRATLKRAYAALTMCRNAGVCK